MAIGKQIANFFLVFFILFGSFFFLQENGYFDLQNIRVQISPLHEEATQIQNSLNAFIGTRLWQLDLSQIKKVLSQKKWIENFTITRSYPSTLQVDIKAKEVKMVLLSKNGKFYPLVNDGNFLDEIDLKKVPNVVLLQGENFEKKIELRKKALEFYASLPQQGSFSIKTVSDIHFDDKEGLWMTLVKSGILVKIGQDNFQQKSIRVGQVLDYVESKKIDAHLIDANLSKKVLVKLRKRP